MVKYQKLIKDNLSFILLALFFVIIVFFKNNNDKIVTLGINYVFIGLFLLGGLITFILVRSLKLIKKFKRFELLLVLLFSSYVFTVFVSIPIDYYNIRTSENNVIKSVKCRIINSSKRRMNRGMNISIFDETVFIKGFRSEFIHLENGDKNFSSQIAEVKYQEGRFNTIILLNVSIKDKVN